MHDAFTMFIAGATGLLLGAIFYGGLWWTVQRGLSSGLSPLWFPLSFVVRTVLTLAGFYFVAGGGWERLLLCLIGFVVGRLVVMWLTRPSNLADTINVGDSYHAP